ncbi:prefoldin subunit beta [Candidatus Woesearchaeota archaeon]|nr:prefoldin subunit beta [Candidatus Woesearchaeota archaeon]
MAVQKATQEKIQQLQMYEQNLQNFILQKQALQMQLVEIETALAELAKTKTAYRIIGNIMIDSEKTDLQKELESKKETSDLRIKAIERQEKIIRDKAVSLQNEVLGELKEE